MASNTTTHSTVGVHMENSLRERLVKDAKFERRSLSNMVVKIIFEHYEGKPSKSKPLNGAHHEAKEKRASNA